MPEHNELLLHRQEAWQHLTHELLPFWTSRMRDDQNGGFITHFDEKGNDSGEDEKSLIAQTRSIYTLSSAHRSGYGEGRLAELATHGVNFLLDKMWDSKWGGFYWMVDREGNVIMDQKVLYGQSFAIYGLAEYSLATGDPRGRRYAEELFELIQLHATDTLFGGYWEMFHRNWGLCAPGSQGGDRKTLDVHMHLMEAFTTLFECTGEELHRRKLKEIMRLLCLRMLHPQYRTGIPQFFEDWSIAPQIKFDIVWGWDRFSEDGTKGNATDNTSYGHNMEFAWLFFHALDILQEDGRSYQPLLRTILDHTLEHGIDWESGGVYVEGSHSGGVYDREKEFWQQAEVLIGLLEGYLVLGEEKSWEAYKNVHRFVFDKVVNPQAGEWYPLLSRAGDPIWRHMGHSWKINYHTIRSMIQSIQRLDRIMAEAK